MKNKFESMNLKKFEEYSDVKKRCLAGGVNPGKTNGLIWTAGGNDCEWRTDILTNENGGDAISVPWI